MRISGTLGSWVPNTAHYPCLLLGALGTRVLRLCERGMELASAIQFQIYEAASGCYGRLPPWGNSLVGALLVPAPLRLSWACHLSWSHLETTLQSSGTFFLLWPPGGSTTQPSCASLLAGDGFGRGELIIISIYTGSRGKTVAQLWSGCVIQQGRPIHVTALCWVWNP